MSTKPRTGWNNGVYIQPSFDRKIIKLCRDETAEYTAIMLDISIPVINFILDLHNIQDVARLDSHT